MTFIVEHKAMKTFFIIFWSKIGVPRMCLPTATIRVFDNFWGPQRGGNMVSHVGGEIFGPIEPEE